MGEWTSTFMIGFTSVSTPPHPFGIPNQPYLQPYSPVGLLYTAS